MGSKYTRQQIIDERKCGLRFIDRAVAIAGIQVILDETVRIAKESPDIWGMGWSNVSWAFGNAWRGVLWNHGASNGEIASTANLDEALLPEQMQWLAEQLGHRIEDYRPAQERRKQKSQPV